MAARLAPVVVKINTKFVPQIMQIANAAIRDTSRELRDLIRAKISVPFPPPSSPGSPPHKRSGGLRRAIFAKRIEQADWAVGVNQLSPERIHLGIWLELGTGRYRRSYPPGSKGSLGPTGSGSHMAPRPYLMKTFLLDGPRILGNNLKKSKATGGVI